MRARCTWRKLHLAVDAQTGMGIASAPTANDMGDPSQVAALLDQFAARIGSVAADGAYDGAPTYDVVAAHAGDIPVIIPPHVTAVPGTTADHHPSQRKRHIAVMAAKGAAGLAGGNQLRPALAGRNGDGPLQDRHRSGPARAACPANARRRPSVWRYSIVCCTPDDQTSSAVQAWFPETAGEGEPSAISGSMQQRLSDADFRFRSMSTNARID